jgi:hypothetical protein
MSNVKFISAEETEKMFGRFAALRLDTSDIRRKFLSCLYGEDHKQALDIYLPNEGGGPFPAVFSCTAAAGRAGTRRTRSCCRSSAA